MVTVLPSYRNSPPILPKLISDTSYFTAFTKSPRLLKGLGYIQTTFIGTFWDFRIPLEWQVLILIFQEYVSDSVKYLLMAKYIKKRFYFLMRFVPFSPQEVAEERPIPPAHRRTGRSPCPLHPQGLIPCPDRSPRQRTQPGPSIVTMKVSAFLNPLLPDTFFPSNFVI